MKINKRLQGLETKGGWDEQRGIMVLEESQSTDNTSSGKTHSSIDLDTVGSVGMSRRRSGSSTAASRRGGGAAATGSRSTGGSGSTRRSGRRRRGAVVVLWTEDGELRRVRRTRVGLKLNGVYIREYKSVSWSVIHQLQQHTRRVSLSVCRDGPRVLASASRHGVGGDLASYLQVARGTLAKDNASDSRSVAIVGPSNIVAFTSVPDGLVNKCKWLFDGRKCGQNYLRQGKARWQQDHQGYPEHNQRQQRSKERQE